MKIEELDKQYSIKCGDFNNIDVFDFEGVYIIYNPQKENEIVYIGSAYARTISKRLHQYLREKDTGNTLLHAICKKDFDVKKVKCIEDKQREQAMAIIKRLKIKAIPHKDLEYSLIRSANPVYNTAGNEIDTDLS